MKSDRKKKNENKGFYIALCSCIMVIALAGYVGSKAQRGSDYDEPSGSGSGIVPNITIADPTAAPKLAETEIVVTDYDEEDTADTAAEDTPEAVSVSKSTVTENGNPDFTAPVNGKIAADYSGEDIVYNEKLDDWRTHNGIDISCSVGDEVLACGDGTVEKIYADGLGNCILIDHKNGFKSMYANLDSDITLKVGDEVTKGSPIGRVGTSAIGDYTEADHIHFELRLESRCVNPAEYITIE